MVDVRGADAAQFLHAQLTAAVLTLEETHAPLAAWADARGRVRAVVRVCRLPDRWLLVTPRAGADELIKKLRLFVLRSKVTIEVAHDVEAAALLGDDEHQLARIGVSHAGEPNRLVRHGALSSVRIGEAYTLVLGGAAALAELGATLEATTEAAAELAEIRLGIPAITPATAERFVAQMLNLDVLGALSFDKGCYPGQEIIARVHNLGGVKRRARRYALRTPPPEPGSAVSNGQEAVGEVVRAAPVQEGCELLAVVDHAAADGALTCDGAALVELPLPLPIARS